MDRSILVKSYFEEKKFVDSSIQSFNHLLEKGLQEVVEENKEAEPTIIPHNIEKFKIRFGRITVGKPEITEADGSKRPIYPMEARLRKISYSAPIYLEISTYVNDVQRENFVSEVGKMPVMLKSKKDGLYYISFARVKNMPVIIILKALGLLKDEDIVKAISTEKTYEEIL